MSLCLMRCRTGWPAPDDPPGHAAANTPDQASGGGDDRAAIVTVRIAAHRVDGLAEQLAGWGARTRVREPTELRAELARIGEELLRCYRDGAEPGIGSLIRPAPAREYGADRPGLRRR